MANLVDGQSLCLAQGAVLCECILLEKEAHIAGTFQEVLVCRLCLHIEPATNNGNEYGSSLGRKCGSSLLTNGAASICFQA